MFRRLVFLALILLVAGVVYQVLAPPPVPTTVPEEEVFYIYLASPDGTRLLPVVRDLGEEVTPRRLLTELLEGPRQGEHGILPVPAGTQVRSIAITDGIAYVDFSSELITDHWGGTTGELATVYAIVNTLAQLPGIDKVQILVGGREIETLAGHVDLSQPLAPDMTLVAPR
ncbi:MAG: GerMN domain-containing protein [Limnochordia bacterium]|jgi:germination protein M